MPQSTHPLILAEYGCAGRKLCAPRPEAAHELTEALRKRLTGSGDFAAAERCILDEARRRIIQIHQDKANANAG